MEWSIPTDNLTGPRRIGGRASRRGFAFQDAYTCLQLTRLLNSETDIIGVRPEGAQDVDLLYSDGREEYIQIKDSPDARYTLAELRPILQSFAIDLLEAGRSSTIKFTLIARSNNIEKAVVRLRNREASSEDIIKIAELLFQSSLNSPSPQSLMKISDAERYNLAAQLLQQIELHFGMGDEFEGRLSFENHACSEMAEHGVASLKLHDAFNVLKAALDTKHEFTRTDVEELLKRFIGGAAIDLFEGQVEALGDELLSHPASSERIQQFYAGAPIGWDIIAAHGDIEREQQKDLIEHLNQPSETLRLVCIVGEPGAGKSTFMRRVAAELHEREKAFLIRIKSKEDAKVWFLMPTFCQKIKRPFYVLIDDVFRDPDVMSALCDLDQSLPITIIATSRSNEYRMIRFGGKFESMSLKEPSPVEKERILGMLGKTRSDLTPEQKLRMDDANQFLVLMMELKDPMGRRLEEIVQETVEWLQINDESAHRAYEYLCFAYQHSISIPASLLERLDPQGRFYDLPGRPKAQGLIFYDEDRTSNI